MDRIVQPLGHALYILPPYPFEAHTAVLMHTLWGSHDLSLLEDQLRALYDTMTRVGRLAKTRFDTPPRKHERSVTFQLSSNLILHGYPVGMVTNPQHVLLPIDNEDTFMLRQDEPDSQYEAHNDLLLKFNNSSAMTAIAPGYEQLRKWVLQAKDLCEDLAEAHYLLSDAAQRARCPITSILRAVYPAAKTVFPELTYPKKAIGPLVLRRLLHPDDQSMLRYALDQAAGGKTLSDRDRTLTPLTLSCKRT